MKTLLLTRDVVARTLVEINLRGAADVERVVLWLGRDDDTSVTVERVFTPHQEASADYFEIPPVGTQEVLAELRKSRLKIVAQVHSHPYEAFHSAADDRWALIRHVGALSLVLPEFGLRTSNATFLSDVAVFELREDNNWHEISAEDLRVKVL